MRSSWFQFIGWLCLWGSALAAEDSGGFTVTLSPEEVRPGDLITLQVRMDRKDYGEFDLDVPSHPDLHLVSRERIPLRLVDGWYRQGERLLLQPVSSGSLVLGGMTAQLTAAGGVRVVSLPELRLEVLPFDSADENPSPELFPDSVPPESERPLFPIIAAGVLIGGFLLMLWMRIQRRKECRVS